jgi:SAM-dependent methyltransferase
MADWSSEVDVARPNIARVYDYLLGGGHNFEVDRKFARRGLDLLPHLAEAARFNRGFLFRAVRFCLDRGIRQFLDLGSGIPTAGNVHEIAHAVDPRARVVYVDNELVAVAQSAALLEGEPNATAIEEDIRRPGAVLEHPAVAGMLDFDEPVAVLMVAVLHSLLDRDDPAGLIARYRSAMAPGSCLVLSHGTPDRGDEQLHRYIDLYEESPDSVHLRTHEEILALFDGFALVRPGLVWTQMWRSEFAENLPPDPERGFCYAGVGENV